MRRSSSPYRHKNTSHLVATSSKTPLLSNGSLNYCSPKRGTSYSSTGNRWTPNSQPTSYQRVLPPLCNGRAGSMRHPTNPPITTRPTTEPKVKFSSGSKLITDATYI